MQELGSTGEGQRLWREEGLQGSCLDTGAPPLTSPSHLSQELSHGDHPAGVEAGASGEAGPRGHDPQVLLQIHLRPAVPSQQAGEERPRAGGAAPQLPHPLRWHRGAGAAHLGQVHGAGQAGPEHPAGPVPGALGCRPELHHPSSAEPRQPGRARGLHVAQGSALQPLLAPASA